MKQESWELAESDNRTIDSVATFIIFCEDGYHEPTYFRSFEIDRKLKINAIPKQGQSNANFFNAVKYCRDKGLTETIQGVDKLKNDVTENIWCVYDRDENKNHPGVKDRNDLDFNMAIKNALDAGFKVAWSNDSFELWVLLHFEKISANVQLHRNDIYDRLTAAFISLHDPKHNMPELTAIDNFRYQKHLKPRFRDLVIPTLRERINIGLENAASLSESYTDTIAFYDRNPCTMVHHLVNALLAYHTPDA